MDAHVCREIRDGCENMGYNRYPKLRRMPSGTWHAMFRREKFGLTPILDDVIGIGQTPDEACEHAHLLMAERVKDWRER